MKFCQHQEKTLLLRGAAALYLHVTETAGGSSAAASCPAVFGFLFPTPRSGTDPTGFIKHGLAPPRLLRAYTAVCSSKYQLVFVRWTPAASADWPKRRRE